MKISNQINSTGLLLGLLSSVAAAQQFGGSISASSGESDNAFKSNTVHMSERQDTYKLGLEGSYDNQFLSATAEYTGEDRRFAEGSQEERAFVEGRSSVLLGAVSDPVDLQLKHSRRTLLSSPDEVNITTNQDDREMVSAIPRIKKKISNADLITASADYTKINFTKNELNNSDRVTGTLSWLREISKISNLSLQADQTEVSFDNFDFADYRYSNYFLMYSVALRRLSYSLAAGYNQSERDSGQSYSSPTYTANISYQTAYHTFQITSNRAITDTSMGGRNLPSVNLNPTNDGAFNVDQIERTSTELSWVTQVLCLKCTLGFSLHANNDKYLVLSDSSRQTGGAVNFTYSPSDKTNLSYRYSDMEQEFNGSLIGRDYRYKTQLLEFDVSVSRGAKFTIFYQREDRDSDANYRVYKEDFVGAAVSYVF